MNKFIILNFFIISLIFFNGFKSVMRHKPTRRPILIVLSIDGFKYDWLTYNGTPNMYRLANMGSKTNMVPDLSQNGRPNHQSIATGYNLSYHGVHANKFNCTRQNVAMPEGYNETMIAYANWYNGKAPTRNYDVIPVWLANQDIGGTSACLNWPGCDVEFYLTKPRICRIFTPHQTKITFEERLNKINEWLTQKNQVNLIMIWIGELDDLAHPFGIDSKEVLSMIKEIDNFVGNITKMIYELYLNRRTNIIIVSDHGFVNVKRGDDMAGLEKLMDQLQEEDPSFGGYNSYVPIQIGNPTFDNFYVTYNQEAACFTANTKIAMTKFYEIAKDKIMWYNRTVINNTYKPSEGRSRGVLFWMPVFLRFKYPYYNDKYEKVIESWEKKYNITIKTSQLFGLHGFDGDYQSIFIAHGKSIKERLKVPEIRPQELYWLFAKLLAFDNDDPRHGTKGLKPALKIVKQRTRIDWFNFYFGAFKCSVIYCTLFYFAVFFYAKKYPEVLNQFKIKSKSKKSNKKQSKKKQSKKKKSKKN